MLLLTLQWKENKVEVLMQEKITQKEMTKTGYAIHYSLKTKKLLKKEK